jgi:hypothetical protein
MKFKLPVSEFAKDFTAEKRFSQGCAGKKHSFTALKNCNWQLNLCRQLKELQVESTASKRPQKQIA